MAGVTLIVGLCILKDEAVGALQSVRTLLHTIWPVFEVKALYTMLWARSIAGQRVVVRSLALSVALHTHRAVGVLPDLPCVLKP